MRCSPSVDLLYNSFELQSCFWMRGGECLCQICTVRKLPVYFQYVGKIFFRCFLEKGGSSGSLCAIKTKIERCLLSEGKAAIGIIDVRRAETQIGEEDINGIRMQRM